MGRTALYAGSFDPLTLGHLDIVERASLLFDNIIIGVVANPSKQSLFTLEERVAMVRKICEPIGNVRVERFQGLLADYVNANKFDAVVRGLRNTNDYEYEQQMAHINDKLYTHNTQTVFLVSKPELSYISSSMVKEVASLGGDISNWVPYDVKQALLDKYRRFY